MKKKTTKTALLTLLFTLLFSMTVFAKEPVRTECFELVYTNTNSNIRLQPGASAGKAGTVPKGTVLLRTAVLDNGWSEIVYNNSICYISSKLINIQTTNTDVSTAGNNASVTTPQTIGETKTFSNGVTFVNYGYTPTGLKKWCYDYDIEGDFPEFLISAYDATGITNDMSDYDKAVAINNYICKVVEYGYGQVDDRALTAECLDYGYAICVGYANAFDALCTIAGVYTDEVNGMYNKGAHCWNYVLIGDTKYWVDVTANDASNNACLMSTTLWADHITWAKY